MLILAALAFAEDHLPSVWKPVPLRCWDGQPRNPPTKPKFCCLQSPKQILSVESYESPPRVLSSVFDWRLRSGSMPWVQASSPPRLGWEFQFLAQISGTPIGSGILIPFLIPKIPVEKYFSNSAVENSRSWNSDSKIWNSKKNKRRNSIHFILHAMSIMIGQPVGLTMSTVGTGV